MTQVLIVDDDRAIREMLVLALEMEGYGAIALSDGSRVVETLEAAREPRIVLLDMMMPGVDGLEVCRRLVARPDLTARHHIIMMTACPPESGCPPEPVRALLTKPFQLVELLRVVAMFAGMPVGLAGDTPAVAPAAPYEHMQLAS
jgi:CheY-like chemotaxis protein